MAPPPQASGILLFSSFLLCLVEQVSKPAVRKSIKQILEAKVFDYMN